MMTTNLFEELGNVLEYLCISDEVAKSQSKLFGLKLLKSHKRARTSENSFIMPKSLAAQQFLAHYMSGRALVESLFLVCGENEAHLSNLLFGSIQPSYDDRVPALTASDRSRTLQVILNTSKAPLQTSQVHIANATILYTDFKSFTFWRTDEVGRVSRPFLMFNTCEICEEIDFTGSVWASIYPTHYAIVSRTISYTFPQSTKGALFSSKLSVVNDLFDEEREAYSRLSCLVNPFTKLQSLDEFRVELESCSKPPTLLSENKEGIYTLRRYSPKRSALLDFGEPAEELNRGDFVTTYNAGQKEFHREFFLSPRRWEVYEEELKIAAFDILHTLAIRRAKLFRNAFASCIYNILLPPALLLDEGTPSHSYALFLCVNLYHIPKQGGFRRTLSITFLVCPIEMLLDQGKWTGIVSRPAALEELYQLKDQLLSSTTFSAGSSQTKRYTIGGPIKSYLELPNICNIPELLQHVSTKVLQRIMTKGRRYDAALEHLMSSTQFASNLESKIATISLQVEWTPPEGFIHPWERWLATGKDKVFCNSLFRTMFYADYLDPYSADASRHAIRFEEFNIGNTLGADMHGMTLYNPQESLKIILFPREHERYPNYSMVRWMAWQVYIDSALASLRALIYRFHLIVNEREDLHSIIGTLEEMVREFVDFYELDLRDYFYRKEYEKIRTLMQIDLDYEQLLAKFNSSKEGASLREQRLMNKLITSLTIATVTVAVLSTIAQMGALSVFNYLLIVLVLSIAGVWIGYILFDPIRLGFGHLYYALSRLWR